MSEVVHNAPQEFWRPPTARTTVEVVGMVEACDDCGTEFLAGSRYCHVCGGARQSTAILQEGWMRALEFQNIRRMLGLTTPSLIAFLLGIGCVLAAIGVGLIYSVQNFNDFHAIQLFRMQWLVAAGVAFVAGILLNKASR